MGILVTIITVAFFDHWTCSLISKQGVVAWAETLGWGMSFTRTLLSAEERVSHYFLMLPSVLNPTTMV